MNNIFEKVEDTPLTEDEIKAIEHWSRRGEITAPKFVLKLIAAYREAKKGQEAKKN